jgi:putative DNA methylase
MTYRRKLIEVALPLEAINKASAREKSIRHGHPSTLHLWWARRPLAAARAVIFAQMVDDPSGHPERFPTDEAQEQERQRLFRLIEELVKWENTTNETVLAQARDEIWQSWRTTCAENREHPSAAELFNPDKLPAFHDPFAGGGSLPLEAQQLGHESYASDLNPVAVLICKAMIEIPPKFAGQAPVNPQTRADKALFQKTWRGAQGLAEDVRYYGQWMRDAAEKRISYLYPKVEVTAEMARERPDLKPLVGRKLTVIAWLWARTVKSPNPAFAQVDVPLASTFMLSTKAGKEAYVEPLIDLPSPSGRGATGEGEYCFTVKVGKPKDAEGTKNATKLNGANFHCLMSGSAIEAKYIRAEAQAGRMGARLMAVIAEGERGRVYLSPLPGMGAVARSASPLWKPELKVPTPCHDVDRLPMYGMPTWGDAFTPRQLVALVTFADLVQEVRERVQADALAAGLPRVGLSLDEDGKGAAAYADSVAMYLGLGVGRSANYWSSFTPWAGDFIVQTFGRQAIRMVWDHAEVNPFSASTGNWGGAIDWIEKVIVRSLSTCTDGKAIQADAQGQSISDSRVVSTRSSSFFRPIGNVIPSWPLPLTQDEIVESLFWPPASRASRTGQAHVHHNSPTLGESVCGRAEQYPGEGAVRPSAVKASKRLARVLSDGNSRHQGGVLGAV